MTTLREAVDAAREALFDVYLLSGPTYGEGITVRGDRTVRERINAANLALAAPEPPDGPPDFGQQFVVQGALPKDLQRRIERRLRENPEVQAATEGRIYSGMPAPEPPLDVERLARALDAAHVAMPHPKRGEPGGTPLRRRQAAAIAREYARGDTDD